MADAEARLAAVQDKLRSARERLDGLESAPDEYAAALVQKERHLTGTQDPRRAPLLDLADERGRLSGEVAEIGQALQAAAAAEDALGLVAEKLGSALGWNTYDTFFGGGLLADMAEHARLDEAARAAAEADQLMAVLRTELADVKRAESAAGPLAISSATKFVDMWLGNIFTDLFVRDRIKQAQGNVAQSLRVVADVQAQLTERAARARDRLTAIEAERRDLLTS